jgi:hypothetical protein
MHEHSCAPLPEEAGFTQDLVDGYASKVYIQLKRGPVVFENTSDLIGFEYRGVMLRYFFLNFN